MIAIFWMYEGYTGDQFWYGDKLVQNFTPTARTVGQKSVSWLTQLGFGPGYYNNSGVYRRFQKSVFKTEAERDEALEKIKQHYKARVYDHEATYKADLLSMRQTEKRMRKQHPY